MADDRASFMIDLGAPGAKEELEQAARALGMFTREATDADRQAERTREKLGQFGREFQRTSRWVSESTNEHERLARALTAMQHAANTSELREYSQALEYVDRHLGEVAHQAQTAESALEALQRHASRRGQTDIAASLGGIRQWMDEVPRLAAELEKPPSRLQQAWGRAAGAVQVAVGNVMAATAQAALQAARDFAISGAQLAIQRESLEATLTAMLGGTEQMVAAMRKIEEASARPGMTMRLASDSVMRLVQAGMSLDAAVLTTTEFGNAIAFVGKSEQDTAESLNQFIQMLTVGKVTMEDFRPLLERSPQFGVALEKAFGTKNLEKIRDMGLSIGEFAKRFVAALAETERAPDLTANAILNLRNEWDKAKTEFGQGLLGDEARKEADKLADSLKELQPAMRDLGEATRTFAIPYIDRLADLFVGLTRKGSTWLDKLKEIGQFLKSGFDLSILGWLAEILTFGGYQRGDSSSPPLPTMMFDANGKPVPRAPRAPAMPPPALTASDFGDTAPADVGQFKQVDPKQKGREAAEKRQSERAQYIAKLKIAEDAMRASGVAMPGFQGWTADQLQAERFRAEQVQAKDKQDTAALWSSQQNQREATVAAAREALAIKREGLQADIALMSINRQQGEERRRSAVEQLATLDRETAMRLDLARLKAEELALDGDASREAVRAKQLAIELAGIEAEAAMARQKILADDRRQTEEALQRRVAEAKARIDLAKVEGTEASVASSTRLLTEALREQERAAAAAGDQLEYMRVKAERLRLEQDRGKATIAEQILMAGPGSGAIAAMLRQQGITPHDLGMEQNPAMVNPGDFGSMFRKSGVRGDVVSDDAVAQAIADGIPGAVPDRVKRIAELAATKVLDSVADGLGRV